MCDSRKLGVNLQWKTKNVNEAETQLEKYVKVRLNVPSRNRPIFQPKRILTLAYASRG